MRISVWVPVQNFNSRPYVRGDNDADALSAIAPDFNSRPYVRGDGRILPAGVISCKFQFTPLREGRHSENWYTPVALHISIHAPT